MRHYPSMDADDFKQLCSELTEVVATQRMRRIETEIITYVEKTEGRVPTDAEMQKYGMRAVWPDGKVEYKWKGVTFLIIPAITVPCDNSSNTVKET